MTRDAPGRDERAQHGASSDVHDVTLQSTRRSVLRAAGAAAVGGALGTSVPGTVSAQPDNTPPMLERESRNSNLIVDPQGNRVTVRGVNIVDPYRSGRDAPHYKVRGERAAQLATNAENGWHANCIRVPMQPNDIAREGAGSVEPGAYSQAQLESYCEKYVDPIVEECGYQGVYCILDYHRHWPDGPRWDDPALHDEITAFWEYVAARYDEYSHVIYELYNEPTEPYAGHDIYDGGPDVTDPESEETWLKWRDTAQPWVDTVREQSSNLLIIGNPRWSQWVYWAPEHEFEGENLGYVGHFYTQENLRPLSEYFGEPSEQVPVFITEFGFGGSEVHMNGTAEEHVPEFTEFFDTYEAAHPIGWCFDFDWNPAMLDRDYQVSGEWGEWMKSYLADKAGTYEPADPTGDVEPPSAPSGLEASAIGDTAVELDWDAPDGAEAYNLYVDTALWNTTTEPPGVVSGLEPGDQYLLGVYARNAGGTSPAVEIEINTAPEGEGDEVDGERDDTDDTDDPQTAPPAPDEVWTDEVTNSSIDLAWSSVDAADEYEVYLDGSLETTTSTTTASTTGLSLNTEYVLGVRAVNDAGESEVVETTATTDPDATATCADGEGVRAEVDGQTVCDVNGDGLYRDVTGDGSVGQTDVVEFFQVQHRDAWKQPSMFDFSGDGTVGHGDVVQLFEDVATDSL